MKRYVLVLTSTLLAVLSTTAHAADGTFVHCSFNGRVDTCGMAGSRGSFTLTTSEGVKTSIELLRNTHECGGDVNYKRTECGQAITTSLSRAGRIPANPVIRRWKYQSALNEKGFSTWLTLTGTGGSIEVEMPR